jgi:hypothetical protein
MRDRLAIIASMLLLSACSVVGVRSGTEEPGYEALGTEAGIEIRRYATRMVAETTVAADEAAARSEGFSRLARYIFGANRGSAKIAMTAPVAQEPTRIAMTAPVTQQAVADGYRIRFFLPAALRDPPAPNDPRVTITEVPGQTVAVLRFSGVPDPGAVAEARAQLLAALPRTRWAASGDPVAWFYDPPWTIPALRRNEVAVPVSLR